MPRLENVSDGHSDDRSLSPSTTKTWRRWNDIADIFNGPSDPDWTLDRDLVSHQFEPPRIGNEAGSEG